MHQIDPACKAGHVQFHRSVCSNGIGARPLDHSPVDTQHLELDLHVGAGQVDGCQIDHRVRDQLYIRGDAVKRSVDRALTGQWRLHGKRIGARLQ